MSIPAGHTNSDAWVLQAVISQKDDLDCSTPLPKKISLQEAAFLQFRVDAILEEWIFPKTNKHIKDLTLREISAGQSTSSN